mgnify:CR=1 FL=1
MAKPGAFVHLHNHSTYSLLDGAQRIDEMCSRAAQDGQPAVAITDHGNLFGVMEFGKRAKKHSIKPIIGMEAYVALADRRDRDAQRDRQAYHMELLAMNQTGYRNLMCLATTAQLDGFYYRPRVDKELLRSHNEGLIALSACLHGEVPWLIVHNRLEEARRRPQGLLQRHVVKGQPLHRRVCRRHRAVLVDRVDRILPNDGALSNVVLAPPLPEAPLERAQPVGASHRRIGGGERTGGDSDIDGWNHVDCGGSGRFYWGHLEGRYGSRNGPRRRWLRSHRHVQ